MSIATSTIFAAATPPGISGVALVRLSGPMAFDVVRSLGGGKACQTPRTAVFTSLRDPQTDDLIDQALVLTFPAPASFTGEDVAEFHCHGSKAVLATLMQVLGRMNLRPAQPGEFARRALQNGKMDLLDVESLDSVLQATDLAQLRIAQGQVSAARQALFDSFHTDLLALMARCEVLIDFPDDDLPEVLVRESQQRLRQLLNRVENLLNRSLAAQQIENGLEVLLVGPPNAGKSTLLNAIAGYEKAIVTKIPGTTRDFVELDMALGPFSVRFVDTAGLRNQPADSIETIGIERTRTRLASAALVLNLYETGTQPLQLALSVEVPVWSIETKCAAYAPRKIGAGEPGKLGVAELLEAVQIWLQNEFGTALEGLAFQKERQMFHVKHLHEALTEAEQQADFPELQGESLRCAAQALGYLSGKIHVEDVLDLLFAGFCIGK